MKVRIIHSVLGDLMSEELYFTEDFKTDVNEFLTPGYTLDSDTVVDIDDLPTCFPMETGFRKN